MGKVAGEIQQWPLGSQAKCSWNKPTSLFSRLIEVPALQSLRQQAKKEKFICFVINVNNDTSGVVCHLFDRQLYSSAFCLK